MKKGWIATLAVLLLLIQTPTAWGAAERFTVSVNGSEVDFKDAAPYLSGSALMVPVRAAAEKLGWKVSPSADMKELLLASGDAAVRTTIGSGTATVQEVKRSFTPASVLKQGRVYVPLAFFKEILGAATDFPAGGTVASITAASGMPQTAQQSPPSLPLPSGVVEEAAIVGKGSAYALPGTLTLPKSAPGLLPAVVLVHGSGPSDRDETVYGYKPFRDIAYSLAEQGIAVLRYDKRTYTYGSTFTPESAAKITVKEETVEDAIAAARLLKNDPRIDPSRVYIIGHSLGGMLAPRIDAEGGDFAGLVLLAGSPRSLLDIMFDQNYAVLATLDDNDPNKQAGKDFLAQERKKADQLAGMTDAQAMTSTVLGVPAYYFKEMDEHKTTDVAAALTKPLLVLQGQDDFQVYADKDYVMWQELFKSKTNAQFKLYPGLNHFFVDYEGAGAGTVAEYSKPGSVAQVVLDDIADFILKR
ncbi:hypothetical protein GCM10010912_38310 [Paenibacillus albidus]|uniref:Alpha/beta fold hydrolase n=1 Tax=Paenibacillus albidus TaxID=2041023 RepID=A0A917FKN3_9BACL|nr:alpha/beta fold hydrolase [Paenibacillus albidus]GGF89501.1 hypothetical protein GCM10010912_38310 [Paenibacillus albidus]